MCIILKEEKIGRKKWPTSSQYAFETAKCLFCFNRPFCCILSLDLGDRKEQEKCLSQRHNSPYTEHKKFKQFEDFA